MPKEGKSKCLELHFFVCVRGRDFFLCCAAEPALQRERFLLFDFYAVVVGLCNHHSASYASIRRWDRRTCVSQMFLNNLTMCDFSPHCLIYEPACSFSPPPSADAASPPFSSSSAGPSSHSTMSCEKK